MAFDINIKDCKHTPSFITAGLDGDTGKEGLRGTSLYFSNYDLSNDYYKDTIIRKITNNIMLSSDADVKQEGREYINGDLILCTDKKVYMIKKENGVYDIECIGILKDENITNDFKDNIINVTVNVLYEELTIGTESMRSFNTTDGNINGKTYCLRLKPHIYTTTDTGYDYFLRIYLYNKKYIHGGEYTLNEKVLTSEDKQKEAFGLSLMNNYIEFYKKTEFRLCDSKEYDDSYDTIIPEMSMDLLHPSNNNININYEKSSQYYINLSDTKYVCTKKDIHNIDKNYINECPVNNLKEIVQFEKNTMIGDDKAKYNIRGGESCYFSGSTDYYTDKLVYMTNSNPSKEYVCDQMFSFLTSDKNKIEIVCVNRETRRIEIIDTKDSNVKCKFIITNEQTI